MIWLILTITIFYSAQFFALKYKNPFNNPLLIAVILLITLLIYFNIGYSEYFNQNKWLNYLLEPAVVALAYPLYEQLHQIRANWKVIVGGCVLASFASIVTGGIIAILMGADPTIVASVIPKSVTTPIAMAIASQIGGEPSITAVLVILAGLFGAILGYPIAKLIGLKNNVAIGLSMGSVSHALGTATAAQNNSTQGAFSSLALVLCGIITSILAPILAPIIFYLFN